MNNIETLTAFFGWCTVINMVLMTISVIMILAFRGPISRIHSKMFGLSEEDLSLVYFKFLAQYKITVFVFNLVPYVALKIMS